MSRLFRYLFSLVCGAVPALALFFGLRPLRLGRLKRMGLCSPSRRETALALFWMYCGGAVILGLTPRWVVRSLAGLPLGVPWNAAGLPFFSPGNVNLVLFDTFSQSTYILAANIIMFVPFGLFSALLWRGYTWKRALLTGVCITGSIECWQLCVGRTFDIDDIILNILGVFCGYLLWVLLRKFVPAFTERFQVWKI